VPSPPEPPSRSPGARPSDPESHPPGPPSAVGAANAEGASLLDDYRALRDPARRREVERRRDIFVVEGRHALEVLLESAHPVRSVLVAEPKAAAVRALVAGRAPVLVVPAAEMAEITGFAFHRGVLASAARLPLPAVDDVVAGASTVAVLEGLNDHENLGALFRNAAAFGVGAVLLDPTTADPLYRRSVRVSAGHVLRVPWTRLGAWPEGLDVLRDHGFHVVALTPAAEADPLDALARDRPRRIALLLGAEGPGLTAGALAAADQRARIPIAAGVDSLNVATAAAVAFHVVGAGTGPPPPLGG
jgi:tRNA G18 (ribose-2'-O)-methylase SpoU